MKSVKMTLYPVQTLCVPFAHFNILQGLAYRLMSGDKDLAAEIHDRSFSDKKAFKFFCFTDLEGRYTIRNKMLVFNDTVSWEIRSADDRIIDAVVKFLQGVSEIEVNRNKCMLLSYEIREKHFNTDVAYIKMSTPIVVYNTLQSGYVRYYNPFENEFFEKIASNIRNKYEMFYGTPLTEEIVIECDEPSDNDKCVTHYKNHVINAWYGTYRIQAPAQVLEMIWHMGIGSKNSTGFGTFNEL